MQDLFAALITFFLVEPVQQQIAETLAEARVPQDVVASVMACGTEHGPQIVDRALNDPFWAASGVIGLWFGVTEPTALLAEAAPACAAATEAVQPFLEAEENTGV